jgi:hypothetical protein
MRVRFVILITALSVSTASTCQAGGTYRNGPMFPDAKVAQAGMPSLPMPNVTARDLVGGCGRGRIRDQQTHGCRGPGDIR